MMGTNSLAISPIPDFPGCGEIQTRVRLNSWLMEEERGTAVDGKPPLLVFPVDRRMMHTAMWITQVLPIGSL
jgi:hypothetical protein